MAKIKHGASVSNISPFSVVPYRKGEEKKHQKKYNNKENQHKICKIDKKKMVLSFFFCRDI